MTIIPNAVQAPDDWESLLEVGHFAGWFAAQGQLDALFMTGPDDGGVTGADIRTPAGTISVESGDWVILTPAGRITVARERRPAGGHEAKYGDLPIGEPGEPLFVLRAKDRAAVQALGAYLGACAKIGADPEHLDGIHRAIDAFADWQETHETKVPD